MATNTTDEVVKLMRMFFTSTHRRGAMGLSMCLCTMHSQAWNSLRQTWVPVPEETLAKLKQLAAEEHVAVVEASCETCSAIVLESFKSLCRKGASV